MTWLLDGNLLLALANPLSPFHADAHIWFAGVERFATCPITQGTLLRVRGNEIGFDRVWETLRRLVSRPDHEFWCDDVSYVDVAHTQFQGGAQVTDAYLAALARRHGGRVATFDRAFSAMHADVVTNIGAK